MSEYERRGASSNKADVHRALESVDPGLYPTAFCKIIPDIMAQTESHCVALHADGAGTKTALAYIHYREFGDPSVFRGIAQDSLVMNLDDLICVGATGPFVLSNTIGRNAKLVSGAVIGEIVAGYDDCIDRLRAEGILVQPCGGETADLGDLVRTVIVDSTLAARLPRKDVIDCSGITPGQVIIGFASFGQTTYEASPNSGIGTNGFTSARHVLLSPRYGDRFPETFAPEIAGLAYQGRFSLSDSVIEGFTLGEALLSPTRTYAPVVKRILSEHAASISAIFHNSGGGLTKCRRFGTNLRYVKDNLFPPPPIFLLIWREGNFTLAEMCSTFNMGQRLEIISDERSADAIIEIAGSYRVEAKVIGHVESSAGVNTVRIEHAGEVVEF